MAKPEQTMTSVIGQNKPGITDDRASRKFGLRWQSEAATPLFARSRLVQKRRGATLPAALQSAFTLIELILVLALLVIITSLAAPAMSNFIRGRALDSEARRLMALIHAGQSRAVSEGMPMVLWVDEKQGAYGLQAETTGQNGDPKEEDLTLDEYLKVAVMNAGPAGVTKFRNLPAIRFCRMARWMKTVRKHCA